MREQILFHNGVFNSKKAVHNHIKDIVLGIPVGETIDENHPHFGLCMELLNRHHEQIEIYTRGLRYFVFIVGPQWGEKQLNAVCRDNTTHVLTWNYTKLTARSPTSAC